MYDLVMTLTKADLEIDETLSLETAKARNLTHELDVLIDPSHPERGLEELMKFKTEGHSLGQPSPENDERYVGVYEASPPGDDDQPLDLLDDEPDTSLDV